MPVETPHQISYEEVCLITGKLFLESQNEIGRLTAMLLDLQKKYSQLEQDKLGLEAVILPLQKRISEYEKSHGTT